MYASLGLNELINAIEVKTVNSATNTRGFDCVRNQTPIVWLRTKAAFL